MIELLKDWDELNLAFKSLLFIGGLMFLIIALLTVFGNEGNISQDSIESMFRTTVSSVFGFLLSSNIKNDNKKRDFILTFVHIHSNIKCAEVFYFA